MLHLRVRPRGVFAGVLVSLREKNGNTCLTLRIPYEDVTKKVLGDVYLNKTKTLFSIHLGNEKNYMDELEFIIGNKTNIPLDYVYFSRSFVKYVKEEGWKEKEKILSFPTEDELKQRKRENWLYSSWLCKAR
ncbi:MAG: hypothetical protein E7311_00910 [Clostridiales bacterium]|nr:hypothetical protein [Clostridiales bacterium]